jgi:hypothetical protein
MRRLIFPLILFYCSLGSLLAGDGKLWSGLTPQQQQDLKAGKSIVLEEEVSDNPWPRYTIYHLVKSSSEKLAAVFWDCELDSKYVPNCLSVRIVSRPQPWIHDGEYTLKMPMYLPDEVYVSRNDLTNPAPDVFEISWEVLDARYIKGSIGNIRIEPYGDKNATNPTNGSADMALMRYTNLVRPGGRIAGLLRAKARKEVIESVEAFVQQAEGEIRERPQLVDKQLHDLDRSLEKTTPPIPPGTQ